MMIDWELLASPFRMSEINWRIGSQAGSRKSATLLAYMDARAVYNRLDTVIGPANWSCQYAQGPDGGVLCGIGVRVQRENHFEWVAKQNGADNTQVEAVKGGLSDALKRAAVPWGIGRYLYRLDGDWINAQEGWLPKGRYGAQLTRKNKDEQPMYVLAPDLPAWALPVPAQAIRLLGYRPEVVLQYLEGKKRLPERLDHHRWEACYAWLEDGADIEGARIGGGV